VVLVIIDNRCKQLKPNCKYSCYNLFMAPDNQDQFKNLELNPPKNSKRPFYLVTLAIVAVLLVMGYFMFNSSSNTEVIEPEVETQEIGTYEAGVPDIVKTLCEVEGEYNIETSQGENLVFRSGDQSALFCQEGEEATVWKVSEGSIPEGGTFYFDGQGNLLGFCQLLFRPQDCEIFKHLSGSCLPENYCN
jgi:hypothetical protein